MWSLFLSKVWKLFNKNFIDRFIDTEVISGLSGSDEQKQVKKCFILTNWFSDIQNKVDTET